MVETNKFEIIACVNDKLPDRSDIEVWLDKTDDKENYYKVKLEAGEFPEAIILCKRKLEELTNEKVEIIMATCVEGEYKRDISDSSKMQDMNKWFLKENEIYKFVRAGKCDFFVEEGVVKATIDGIWTTSFASIDEVFEDEVCEKYHGDILTDDDLNEHIGMIDKRKLSHIFFNYISSDDFITGQPTQYCYWCSSIKEFNENDKNKNRKER